MINITKRQDFGCTDFLFFSLHGKEEINNDTF